MTGTPICQVAGNRRCEVTVESVRSKGFLCRCVVMRVCLPRNRRCDRQQRRSWRQCSTMRDRCSASTPSVSSAALQPVGNPDVPGGRLPTAEGSVDRQVRRLHTGWDVYGQRTDTMMLAHLSRGGRVVWWSLPRDSWSPSRPRRRDGQQKGSSEEKLNSATHTAVRPAGENGRAGQRVDDRPLPRGQFRGLRQDGQRHRQGGRIAPAEIDDPPSACNCLPDVPPSKAATPWLYVRAREFDPTMGHRPYGSGSRFVASMVNKASSSAVLLDPARATGFVCASAGEHAWTRAWTTPQVLELTRRLAQLESS